MLSLHVLFCVGMGNTKFVVALRYKGWLTSFDRDRDEYNIMELVRDAYEFLSKPLVERRPNYASAK